MESYFVLGGIKFFLFFHDIHSRMDNDNILDYAHDTDSGQRISSDDVFWSNVHVESYASVYAQFSLHHPFDNKVQVFGRFVQRVYLPQYLEC